MSSSKGFLKERWMIPIAIFVIAFLPRFAYMNDGLFHTDSVIMAIAVENTFKTLNLHYMHPPGYPGQVIIATVLYAIHHALTGAESAEFACTFTSVLLGSLGVVMLYYFVEEFFQSRRAAIFSSLILTVFPVYLSLSTYAKDHATEVFFLLLAAYLSARASRTKSRRLTVLASLACGYAIAIRIVNLLFLPFFMLIYYRESPVKVKKKGDALRLMLDKNPKAFAEELLTLLLPAALMFLLLYLPMFTSEGIQPLRYVAGYARWLGIFSDVLPTSLEWATISITPLGWLLFAAGFLAYFKREKRKSLVILGWAVAFFLYGGNLGITTPRYVIPALVPVVMFMGVALDVIWGRAGNVASVIVLIILMSWMFFTIQPILEFRSELSGPKAFALEVMKNTEPNALILTMDQSYHIEYYAKRRARGYSVADGAEGMDKMLADVDISLENGTPVYVMTSLFSYPGRELLMQKMDQEYNFENVGTFLNEDWHRDSIFSAINNETLLRISKKSP
ncbi:MAG: glycosyltransferase family 39 protein [Candidatus Altiarchaeota archaeon]